MTELSMRDSLVFTSKLCEQAERFEEMVEKMKKVVKTGKPLSTEERNLLSVAYKNVVGDGRNAWRIVSSIEDKQLANTSPENPHLKHIQEFRKKIESELTEVCDDVLKLIDVDLIPNCNSDEAKVFFLKMKGDYCRYKCEYLKDEKRKESSDIALDSYTEAFELAKNSLVSTHPIRLGLVLNFSVFNYEIIRETETACFLAKSAFDEGVQQLDILSEESYRDSTLIMQLLRDNLQLWNSEKTDSDAEECDFDSSKNKEELK